MPCNLNIGHFNPYPANRFLSWKYQLFKSTAYTVKPVLSGHSKRTKKKGFFITIQGSILQYFWPSLSYHFPLRPLFCLFLSGRLRQVLLYSNALRLLLIIEANTMNPDQTAPLGAVWFESILFEKYISRRESRCQLLWIAGKRLISYIKTL